MKLINITNHNQELVNNHLENTDAYFVQVFSAGAITIVYTEAKKHIEILAVNKQRHIRKDEARDILNYFLANIPKDKFKQDDISSIFLKDAVEISIPLLEPITSK